MATEGFSETSVPIHQNKMHHIPGDRNLSTDYRIHFGFYSVAHDVRHI